MQVDILSLCHKGHHAQRTRRQSRCQKIRRRKSILPYRFRIGIRIDQRLGRRLTDFAGQIAGVSRFHLFTHDIFLSLFSKYEAILKNLICFCIMDNLICLQKKL